MMTNENISDDELFMSDGHETPETTADPKIEEAPELEAKTPKDEGVVQENAKAELEPEKVEEKAKDENHVPSWRLREINEAKNAAEAKAAEKEQELLQTRHQLNQLEQQFKQYQQPQQPPNVFEDPDGYTNYQQQMIAQQGQQVRMQMALLDAKVTYGVKEVDEAVKAAEAIEFTHPHIAARIKAAANPWVEAVNWHKEQKTQEAIGDGGIDGFRQRLSEQLKADPDFRKQVFAEMRGEAVGSTKKPIDSIPSLNGAPRASVNNEQLGAMTEEELFLIS